MAEIYKLSYTAAQVNALLGKLDQADFDGFEDMYGAVETDKSDVETMIAGARGSIEDATEEAIAEVIATIPSDYTALTVQTNRNTEDIENLYAISQGILYREDTDTTTAYTKSVPAGAAPYASVDVVGGMSAKDNGSIHHMAVSKVESVGANLWDEEWGTGGLRNDNTVNTGITTEIYSKNPIKLINKTFKISTPCRMLGVGLDKDKKSLGWINDASSFASGQVVTVPDNCVYIRFMTASSGTYGGTYNDNIAVLNATTPTAYHPHIAPDTLNIPSAIKSLTGYGWGVSDTCYNYADFEAGQYVQMVGKRAYQSGDESDTTVLTDMTYTYYPLATPTVTDISNIDNTIKVEPYGCLTFENADGYEIPTPSKETYIIKLSEVANA